MCQSDVPTSSRGARRSGSAPGTGNTATASRGDLEGWGSGGGGSKPASSAGRRHRKTQAKTAGTHLNALYNPGAARMGMSTQRCAHGAARRRRARSSAQVLGHVAHPRWIATVAAGQGAAQVDVACPVARPVAPRGNPARDIALARPAARGRQTVPWPGLSPRRDPGARKSTADRQVGETTPSAAGINRLRRQTGCSVTGSPITSPITSPVTFSVTGGRRGRAGQTVSGRSSFRSRTATSAGLVQIGASGKCERILSCDPRPV